jgi:hypothetical protein
LIIVRDPGQPFANITLLSSAVSPGCFRKRFTGDTSNSGACAAVRTWSTAPLRRRTGAVRGRDVARSRRRLSFAASEVEASVTTDHFVVCIQPRPRQNPSKVVDVGQADCGLLECSASRWDPQLGVDWAGAVIVVCFLSIRCRTSFGTDTLGSQLGFARVGGGRRVAAGAVLGR